MDRQHSDYLIIGAGIAGLACATRLAEDGRQVLVLDKGRGPGGRMAARRAEIAGEVVSFDHGAQYFTARDNGFRAAVAAWEEMGVVARWPAAGKEAWVGIPGMNGPIRAMADTLDVRWGTRALSLSRDGETWFVDAGERRFTAETVLVAVPAEQAHELLEPVAPRLARVPAKVRSEPCWAVMAGFAERLDVWEDTFRDPNAAVSWAARNSAKPDRTGTECWVLHASPEHSRELLHLTKEEVAPRLVSDFFVQAGAAPVAPIHLTAHRWLYAMPTAFDGPPCLVEPIERIGLCGDYLHSPRVEGAWISGTRLASWLLN